MKSSATAEFWRRFAALPGDVQQRTRKAYRLWVRDPHHNSLRFKKISGVWSVRIFRGYRALGLFKGDTVHWFWIGPHDEYERIIKSR
jgi:hypothetical protein